jgi:RNA polymerase sigma-70 factor (ECF subfamily)
VIYRYAAYMCGFDAGDDIVQDTFLAVLRQTGRHDRLRGTTISYLFGIARHLVMKRLSARSAASFAEPGDDIASETAVTDPATVLDDLTRDETIEAVRMAVHSLPSAYREVIVLCEFQEMDYATAAGVIECPIGTVRSRLHRARTLLTSKLAAVRQATREGRG